MPAHEHCWQCGSPDAGSMFCHYCNSLQAPTPDYYEFFGMPRLLALDGAGLQKKFYSLSRLLHPDRYTLRNEQEQRYSLQASAILNDAYRTMRDPIRRAEYVLHKAGVEVGEGRSKEVPPELLEEVFELNMALDELRMGDVEVLPQLEESRTHFLELQGAIDGELDKLFHQHDTQSTEEGRAAALERIRAVLHRRRYIRNLVNEVDKLLAEHNG